MKILFALAERYPTHRADVMALFGRYLPRLGVSTDLLCLHDPAAKLPPWNGGRLLSMAGSVSLYGKHLRTFFNDLRLLWLARQGYQAVQVRDKALCALVGLIAARLAGIQFYYWMSYKMPEAWIVFARERRDSLGVLRWLSAWFRGRFVSFLLYRVVLPRADHVFVQSDCMLEEVARKGIGRGKMTAVPMGVDFDACGGAGNPETPVARDRPTFIYLGTLNRLRHPEVMIDAVDIVRRSVPDVALLLVGDAEEQVDRDRLRDLVASGRLEGHVTLTGWLPSAEGWALAGGCIAGLSPFPRSELLESASPTKAVEYFALGLPVIANDQPDQAAVVEAAGGRCVPLTAEGFASAMLDAIAHPHAYIGQGVAGRLWVRANRSYEVISKRVADRYARLQSLDGAFAK